MSIDPISLAQEIKRAYALNLIGTDPIAFKGLLSRFGDLSRPIEEKLSDLVKMRGPYLQALGIPNWSNRTWESFAASLSTTFAPEGFATEITETFRDLGFKRLYEFQEEGIEAVLNDQNALIVAATGRGKTESWMLPLFQYIIARKRGIIQDGTPAKGVKALLIYPTKALAQDQLKRLIRYLFRLNDRLEPAARISVGIYDGDTPSENAPDVITYLYDAFKHFRCPIYDPDQDKCMHCKRSLQAIRSDAPGGRIILTLPNPVCYGLVDLGFIELTRDDVIDRRPDIILTNPDMLNLRLLNINEDAQRAALIEEPKFIVLDEVHTYTELFGTFTAFIIKRLRQERARLQALRTNMSPGEDHLRIIAASATVANKEEHFARLCNLPTSAMAVIEERSAQLPASEVNAIPAILIQRRFSETSIEENIRTTFSKGSPDAPHAELLALFGFTSASYPKVSTADGLIESVGEMMFGRLSAVEDAGSPLQIVRYLHSVLQETPMTPADLEHHLLERFPDLAIDEIDTLINNFVVLGAVSGVLENRVHLFTWPIDGYYTCLYCGRVYDQPQQSCECGGEFITKLALCNECGEEALEAWLCSHCQRLYPLSVTVEGENVYYRGFTCSCTGEDLPTIRVVWRPYYQCSECGHITKLDKVPVCQACEASLVRQDDHWVCSNPACRREYAAHTHATCPACHGSLSPVQQIGHVCQDCGTVLENTTSAMECACGGNLVPFTHLPWVCNNCEEVTFADQAPTRCNKCGKRLHGLGALFDISSTEYCPDCDKHYLVGHSCGVKGHSFTAHPMDFRAFSVVDGNWRVRQASQLRNVTPCYHPYVSYNKNSRYETLMRSPANVAVTSAQYVLRALVGDASDETFRDLLTQAKILSFSDSHSDMEQLGQDFDEPEKRVFIDQLVVDALEQGELLLSELVERCISRIEAYSNLLSEVTDQRFDWLKHFDWNRSAKVIESEVTTRFLPGYGSWRPALVRDGIADIHLHSVDWNAEEQAVIERLVRNNGQRREKLQTDLADTVTQFNAVVEHLAQRGILCIDRDADLISFEPSALVCSLVSEEHPLGWLPKRRRFYSTLEQQVGIAPNNLQPFTIAYQDRADFSHPNFSRSAFRINYSHPLILRSEVYKGDVEKKKRRQIEHTFKFGNSIHFLSSGPTMEMGIDIGDLDLLLLFGTPPNINAYLQRVGRGGRRNKRSLVVSVSKRNPIDYYYYRRPQELISSEPQPVPLNEHNEEVMRISLTWALLDFIASTYWVPWRVETHTDGDIITDGEDFRDLGEPRPSDVIPFTTLVYVRENFETDYGYPLKVLSTILHDREDEARAYLRRLLDYPICSECGIHGEAIGELCPTENCSGQLVGAHTRYVDIISEVIEQFDEHMVVFLENFRDDLEVQSDDLSRKRDSLRTRIRQMRRASRDERRLLQQQADNLSKRVEAIEEALSNLRCWTFTQTQRYSSESKYAYQIRSVSDVVEVITHYIKQGRTLSDALEPRDMGMAIKEYHPYAIVLRGRRKYVTCQVTFDDWKTELLNKHLDEAGRRTQYLTCTACEYIGEDTDKTTCRCGNRLRPMRNKVLRQADIYPLDFPLGSDPESPGRTLLVQRVFRFGSDQRPESTFTETESQICRFEARQRLAILTQDESYLGDLELGDLEVVTFANHARVSYQSGLSEPRPMMFEICGVEGCNGVLIHGEGTTFCALDPSHDINRRQIVRPAYLFETEGVRLRLYQGGAVVAHSFAHGLRLALEKIGGVLVRSIGELIEGENVYIYDTTPGGSGVTRLLTLPSGNAYPHFAEALETMGVVAGECQCDDGCPHCLYQYGCFHWNSPRTLSRQSLLNLLSEGLYLAPPSEVVHPEPEPIEGLIEPIWAPEEKAARDTAWNHICELESRLRILVTRRYENQYGEDWLEKRVEEDLRVAWEATQEKEEDTHIHYGTTVPPLLHYSYLADLRDLINREWSLFHDVFGSGKTAKRELQGKIEAINRVRNPLAHNRAVPENELKRAEVYCTDILLQLKISV